ncbi:Insulin-like growth factor binding protein, N-terminal [Pseudocohnilembus persalinus]|uniref:Insulin-like growth factor binding protein, N-terminal n=1 Tax=Pseudocohnilembus persalinus TaxID=266149 RepID=A0A0V0R5Q0_PSEPJ|nr:Insulin-like growth factor binding protein, N-terminal [Pseudocohnilembus persalinus]|eukprot:KRX09803.1 Insulin-like growth factor binding protein, N-terminal [Pseudocohnilembus persalinus]
MYTIVTAGFIQQILTIYTFKYDNGEIQDICLKSFENEFPSNFKLSFFNKLVFGVINQDYMWIKGENEQSTIIYANPTQCELIKDESQSIIFYQMNELSDSHVLDTFNKNGTVQIIVLSSHSSVYKGWILAQLINIGEICPYYCVCDDNYVCISCISSHRDKSNFCFCENKYYQDSQSEDCLACPEFCETCYDQNNCQTCVSSSIVRDTNNQCSCPVGYYQDPNGSDCLSCPTYCETCTDSNTCQSCKNSNENKDIEKQCFCQNGFYQDTQTSDCLECPKYCASCENEETCLSCDPLQEYRDQNNLCKCKDGYYEDSLEQVCKSCPQYCIQCVNSENCISCLETNGQRNKQNLCKCSDGFYQDVDSVNCLQCPEFCLTCTDQNICLTCIEPQDKRDANNKCKIIDGFYSDSDDPNIVLPCMEQCATCDNGNSCTSCEGSYKNQLNQCQCFEGFELQEETNICHHGKNICQKQTTTSYKILIISSYAALGIMVLSLFGACIYEYCFKKQENTIQILDQNRQNGVKKNKKLAKNKNQSHKKQKKEDNQINKTQKSPQLNQIQPQQQNNSIINIEQDNQSDIVSVINLTQNNLINNDNNQQKTVNLTKKIRRQYQHF